MSCAMSFLYWVVVIGHNTKKWAQMAQKKKILLVEETNRGPIGL